MASRDTAFAAGPGPGGGSGGASRGGQMIELGARARACLCLPRGRAVAGVLLIHEWWGLNFNIKSLTERVAGRGYLGLAVDLYDGRVARDAAEADRLAREVRPERAQEILSAALAWLRTDPLHKVGRIGTIGWGFGGKWALATAMMAGRDVQACVVFYGEVPRDPAKLARLSARVLGIFAIRDRWISPQVATDFAAAMRQAGKVLERVDFPADHAFANPSSPGHDGTAARAAWDRTMAFLGEHLR
jgi:carboxymethylenebutenolidase